MKSAPLNKSYQIRETNYYKKAKSFYTEYPESVWSETDDLTGAVRNFREIDETEIDFKTHLLEKCDAEGNIVGGTKHTYKTIGAGTAAVERMTESVNHNGLGGTTYYHYHERNFNPQVNGKLKTVYHADGSWECHVWDESGRETLRINSKDGKLEPKYVREDAADFEFNPSGSYPDMNAEVIVLDYMPHFGDGTDWLDAGKHRTETRYRVANNAPVVTARVWYKYNRATINIFGEIYSTITHTTVRAATQSSAITDPANRISVETSFLDSYCGSLHLDGRLLYRRNEDGSTTTWEYEFDVDDAGDDILCVTTHTGTETLPMGIPGESAYEYEEIKTATGYTSLRATLLNTSDAEDPVLSWESNTYDDKGRLTSTEYSDGTTMNNVWTCCALQQTIDRDGAVTEYFPDPSSPNWSASGVSSHGSLPGAAGYFTVTENNTDSIGRATNSVRSVRNSSFVRDTSYAQQITTIEYPQHTSHLRVTTDHLGIATTNRTYNYYDGNENIYCVIEETIRAGVKTTVKRPVNGEAEITTEWTDSVSGANLKKMTKTESEIQPNGWEKRTSYVKYDNGAWITQSKTVSDLLGRTVYVETPLGTTSNFYDSTTGRLIKVSRAESADTLYEYNSLGEQIVICQDVDGDGAVDYAGLDRINRIDRIFELRSNDWWQTTVNEVWAETNSTACITSSITRVRMTGLGEDTYNGGTLTAQNESENWLGNVTRTSTYADADSVTTWTVTDTPESNIDAVQQSVAGYPVQSVSSSAITNSWMYDGFSRQISASDGRTNTTVTAYNDLGQVAYTQNTTNRTSYLYNSLGQRSIISNALGQVSHTAYDPQGNTIATWGTSYPVAYQFDAAGRMIALATTRTNDNRNINLNTLVSSGDTLTDCNVLSIDVTRWLYNESTGLLTEKLYADGNGTSYTYTDSGKLATRKWARNIITTYSYDSLNQLIKVDYSLWSTPDVTFTYDRIGRMTAASSSASTRIFEYTGLALTKEVQDNYIIERIYDTLGRAIGYELYSPDDLINPVQVITYGYSNNGRFSSVSSVHSMVTNTFTYAYLFGTDLISGYTASSSGTTNLTVSRSYETDRNLVTAFTNAWNTAGVSSFDYINDPLGRRTKRTDYFNASTINNDFDYNDFSEVTGAIMGNDSHTLNYDPIGNRLQSTVNSGQSSVTNIYISNNLNQYTSVSSVPSVVNPTFDSDGNMTWNGRKSLAYDAENRLQSETPSYWGITNGATRTDYTYDYMNRRVSKTTSVMSGRSISYPPSPLDPQGSWSALEIRKYIYNDWNLVAEIIIDQTEFTTNMNYYTWGLDLSGSIQGAGGVGGLLAATVSTPSTDSTYLTLSDANGNITEYVDNTGAVTAHYKYNAFGAITFNSGTMKDDFAFRFSSKYFDPETGFYYYGNRYYDVILGCWISKDSIEEWGGLNLYVFVENNAIGDIDVLGQSIFCDKCCPNQCAKNEVDITSFRIFVVPTLQLPNPDNIEGSYSLYGKTLTVSKTAIIAALTGPAAAVGDAIASLFSFTAEGIGSRILDLMQSNAFRRKGAEVYTQISYKECKSNKCLFICDRLEFGDEIVSGPIKSSERYFGKPGTKDKPGIKAIVDHMNALFGKK